jgi:L-aminopeptidase/D-esterase-like protein
VGEVKIAVFTVVNASGAVHDRQGMVISGNRDPETGERLATLTILEHSLLEKGQETRRQGNTTLTLVATNLKMTPQELQQLARQVHHAMGRAIQPFATLDDGDILYAVTTDEVEGSISPVSVGVLASELAWDAVLSIYRV